MAVSGLPLPCQSWLPSISARSISIKHISGIHQKFNLALMVLHATLEKVTTWKALCLLSRPRCPRKCLFSQMVASSKVKAINVLNDIDMTPTVHRQAKEELIRRTQSRLPQTAISHILQNQFLYTLAQAGCRFKPLRCFLKPL